MLFSQDRRNLLKVAGVLVSGIAVPDFLTGGAQAEEKKDEIIKQSGFWFERTVQIPFDHLKSENEKQSFLHTFVESFAFYCGESILLELKDKFGLTFDGIMNRDDAAEVIKSLYESGKMRDLFAHTTKQVFFETIWFNYLPSVLTDTFLDKKMHMLDVGIPVSFIFAIFHNLEQDEFGERKFSTDIIPWPQFFSGIFYWYLMRKAGVVSAFTGHLAQDYLLVGHLLCKAFDQKKQKAK
jgi:hypothetical protein